MPCTAELVKIRWQSYDTTRTQSCARTVRQQSPEQLPPTERSVYFHSLRMHLQVRQWKEMSTDVADPCEWGWKTQDNKLMPVMTDESPGPDELLKVVRCNCILTSRNVCGTNLCSCVRNGIQCVSACGNCNGSLCDNCNQRAIYDTSSDKKPADEGTVVSVSYTHLTLPTIYSV